MYVGLRALAQSAERTRCPPDRQLLITNFE